MAGVISGVAVTMFAFMVMPDGPALRQIGSSTLTALGALLLLLNWKWWPRQRHRHTYGPWELCSKRLRGPYGVTEHPAQSRRCTECGRIQMAETDGE